MTDPTPPPKTLIVPSATASRELTSFAETGLITAEQQKALTVATTNMALMKSVQTPMGQRHFDRIDTMLSIRVNSPESQARECLSNLGEAWDTISGDFHKYRELYFEAKLRKAKLHLRQKRLDASAPGFEGVQSTTEPMGEDERAIEEAEIALERARIDKLEAEVAKGHAALQGQVTKATQASDRYALICKQAGKEAFTEEDFRKEEIDYYLQSAWWNVAQSYGTIDTRNKWKRPTRPPKNQREAEEWADEARKWRRVDIKHEIVLYFEGLGISRHEIDAELGALLGMRESFDMVNTTMSGHSNPQPFAPRFDQWVRNMATKYRDRATKAIGEHGFDRIKRISSIISPTDSENATGGDVGKMDRRSMLE